MGFAEIVGHQKQVEIVRQALNHGRLHHAYLFVGMEGVGKKTIALGLAKAIHCSAATGDFCGECPDCARIQASNHPDVRIIEPLAGKKRSAFSRFASWKRNSIFDPFPGRKKSQSWILRP